MSEKDSVGRPTQMRMRARGGGGGNPDLSRMRRHMKRVDLDPRQESLLGEDPKTVRPVRKKARRGQFIGGLDFARVRERLGLTKILQNIPAMGELPLFVPIVNMLASESGGDVGEGVESKIGEGSVGAEVSESPAFEAQQPSAPLRSPDEIDEDYDDLYDAYR